MANGTTGEHAIPEPGTVEWCAWRMDQNDKAIETFRTTLADGNPFGLPPVWLGVSPGLVRPGEQVELTFSARGDEPPRGDAFVQADYLAACPGPALPLSPAWERDDRGTWTARHGVRADRPGNWRVTWDLNNERLSRVFGVAVPGQTVVTLWVGCNKPPLDREIHRFDLPGDTWIGDWGSPFEKTAPELLDRLRDFALSRHRYGDRAAPFVNADWSLPGIRNLNFLDLPADVQRRCLVQTKDMWGLLGLGPMELVASYTPGHATPAILAELGVKALTSLCVWQNVHDGNAETGWSINHMGAPNAPYYIAGDDFRKVAPDARPVLGFSMGSTSDVRCYDWICYDGCATNCMPSQRYVDNAAISANVHRFFVVVDGWIADARNNPDLVFVTAALENFRGSTQWREANYQAVDYMVRRAAEGKIVFASAADISDFYRRHYERQPETVQLWADCYSGFRHENRPATIPDRIEMSNSRFHSLHRYGRALPAFLWDYTRQWNDPEWSALPEKRSKYGTIEPDRIAATVDPFGSVPRQSDLRGVKADVSSSPSGDGLELRVLVDSPRPIADLPVAVWDIPLECRAGAEVECGRGINGRFVRVRDRWTGNLHGVLVLKDIPSGTTRATVRLEGTAREPEVMQFEVSGLLGLRTFRSSEGPRTYFWRLDGVAPCKVTARVPAGTPAAVQLNDGTVVGPGGDGEMCFIVGDSWKDESPCMVGAETVLTGGTVDVEAVHEENV